MKGSRLPWFHAGQVTDTVPRVWSFSKYHFLSCHLKKHFLKFFFLTFKFISLVCLCGYCHDTSIRTCWGQRTTFRSCCSPSTIWFPGIELRSSGLATIAFTLRALLPVPKPFWCTFGCLNLLLKSKQPSHLSLHLWIPYTLASALRVWMVWSHHHRPLLFYPPTGLACIFHTLERASLFLSKTKLHTAQD